MDEDRTICVLDLRQAGCPVSLTIAHARLAQRGLGFGLVCLEPTWHWQGIGFGHAKVGGYNVWLRGYNPLIATLSTPLSAPVITATRLRAANAGSARGAANMITEAITTAHSSPLLSPCSGASQPAAPRTWHPVQRLSGWFETQDSGQQGCQTHWCATVRSWHPAGYAGDRLAAA
ncbi:hypothetical protein [Salinispora pacifica]|uniref:hypothetical protein n=1 Tax=Salinispora pacifica TaxID=351187 RepID=UPI000483EBD3|nr:hypothetical protein [Salinispora pacifica]